MFTCSSRFSFGMSLLQNRLYSIQFHIIYVWMLGFEVLIPYRNRNRNDKQLELNACMLAPTPLLICQSPTVVRKRSRMAITNSNWTTEVAVVTLSGFG